MNKHTKLAILLVPFLTIGGFVAAGYYSDHQKEKTTMHLLEPQGECNVVAEDCKLGNGDLLLNIASRKGMILLATTHAIDSAVVAFVPEGTDEQLYPMKQGENAHNWIAEAKPLDAVLKSTPSLKMRLLVTIKNTTYLSEFATKTSR